MASLVSATSYDHGAQRAGRVVDAHEEVGAARPRAVQERRLIDRLGAARHRAARRRDGLQQVVRGVVAFGDAHDRDAVGLHALEHAHLVLPAFLRDDLQRRVVVGRRVAAHQRAAVQRDAMRAREIVVEIGRREDDPPVNETHAPSPSPALSRLGLFLPALAHRRASYDKTTRSPCQAGGRVAGRRPAIRSDPAGWYIRIITMATVAPAPRPSGLSARLGAALSLVALEQRVEDPHHDVVVQKLHARRFETGRSRPSSASSNTKLKFFRRNARSNAAHSAGLRPLRLTRTFATSASAGCSLHELRDGRVVRAQERDELLVDEVVVAVAIAVDEAPARRRCAVTRFVQQPWQPAKSRDRIATGTRHPTHDHLHWREIESRPARLRARKDFAQAQAKRSRVQAGCGAV